MLISRYGLPIILPIFLFTVVFFFFSLFHSGWWWIATGILIVFLFFSLWFFRDPHREISSDPYDIVSPADGKVLEVVEEKYDSFIGGPAYRISIFLSVFDVHINRNMVDGVVHSIERIPGKYLVAFNPRAMYENSRLRVNVDTEFGRVSYTQVTGAIARRIVCNLKVGDRVKKGTRYGMIRFGSRMDIFLPTTKVDITVRVHEHVKGGSTVLARWKHF